MSEASTFPPSRIPAGRALLVWAACWSLGSVFLGTAVLLALGADADDGATMPQLAAAVSVGWAVFVGGMVWASRHLGHGDLRTDYALAVRPIDLLGVPVGIATQLVVVPLVYWPLRRIWPDTFSTEELEERAQDLADRAEGAMVIVLVLVVVVGAPIVEELVYRGLLQRSVSAVAGRWLGVAVVAALFSLIHLSPVEYPGLFAAGFVFGGGLAITGRLGTAIVIHAAFNATGVSLVLAAAAG